MFPYKNDGSPPRERSPYKNVVSKGNVKKYIVAYDMPRSTTKDIPRRLLWLLSVIVLIGIVLYTVVGPNNWPIRMFGLC